MVKICVVTATRAEFGLLKPMLEKLLKVPDFDVRIVATGMHLSPEFGLTYKEIEEAGMKIDRKIEMQLSSDSMVAMSKTMGLTMIGFADYFEETKPDYAILIADRYETLAVAAAAMCMQIPIIHLYGGETTEGAIDECIRHAISKMSYLHFATTESYRKRIIQMGEHPERVFNVGGLGVENIKTCPLFSKSELEESLDMKLDAPYAVVTFHPVTLEKNSAEGQAEELMKACMAHPELKYIFTKANSDASGRIINEMLERFAAQHDNMKIFDSLGLKRYLSAVKYAAFVLGNSSSGIMEVPSFGIPTVNIGDRQRGRMRAESIIDCEPYQEEIVKAMDKALSDEFRTFCHTCKNPYEGKDPSGDIVRTIQRFAAEDKIDLKKKFYNIDFSESESYSALR
ncbi:MAG: UDP-N-acetylglucosamine 2-epimerase [Muribaculum sp.]|nr:UDP-N-acetylglucosamine 2-epimerase [Muribaculum sp.]